MTMAVQFVLGPAGAGRTTWCLRRIIEARREQPLGREILLLLPRQATFAAERELCCALGAMARVRVLSFDELAREVLEDAGGVATAQVSAAGRRMILAHLLRVHRRSLRHFTASAERVGLAALLDRALAELHRGGIAPADLDRAIAEIESGQAPDSSLVARLADLRLLLEAYDAHLGQDRLDPERRAREVTQRIRNCAWLRGAEVYVDGFLDFSWAQREQLAAIAGIAASLHVTMLLDAADESELSIFARTRRTLTLLRRRLGGAGAPVAPDLWLEPSARFASPTLRSLERSVFRRAPASVPPEDLLFVEAASRREEVEAAARQARRLLAEGFRLRDIAVLARDLSGYHELIDAVFREQGLPCFIDRRRGAAHHSLVILVRALARLASGVTEHRAVLELLKSGLGPLEDARADVLENVVAERRLPPDAWLQAQPWRRLDRPGREGEDGEVDAATPGEIEPARRRVADVLRPLAQACAGEQPAEAMVRAIRDAIDRCGAPGKLATDIRAAEAAGQFDLAAEHLQVWREVTETLAELGEVLRGKALSAGQFREVVDAALEELEVAITPPTLDQVLVSSVDRPRALRLRAVLLLGLNDGVMPAQHRPDSVIDDAQRQRLAALGLELEVDSTRRQLDERLLAYMAMALPSERLIVLRHLADDSGRATTPSPYWNALRAAAPQARLRRETRGDATTLGTPRQIVAEALRWSAALVDRPDGEALYDAVARSSTPAIVGARAAALRATQWKQEARLEPATARALLGETLETSVSRVESFARCPYQHFARHLLALRKRPDEDVSPLEIGLLYHGILERLVADHVEQARSLTEPPGEAAIAQAADAVASAMREEARLAGPRAAYLLDRARRTVARTLALQAEMARCYAPRPRRVELAFGRDQPLPPLELSTPRGRAVRVHGRIDRVDIDDASDPCVATLVDYKSGGSTRRLDLGEAYHGLALQLLIYLVVLREHGERLVGRPLAPGAGLYVRLGIDIEKALHPGDARKPMATCEKPRGVLDATSAPEKGPFARDDRIDRAFFDALLAHARQELARLADRVLDGAIEVFPYRLGNRSPCSICEFASLCRFEPSADRYRRLQAFGRGASGAVRRLLEAKP